MEFVHILNWTVFYGFLGTMQPATTAPAHPPPYQKHCPEALLWSRQWSHWSKSICLQRPHLYAPTFHGWSLFKFHRVSLHSVTIKVSFTLKKLPSDSKLDDLFGANWDGPLMWTWLHNYGLKVTNGKATDPNCTLLTLQNASFSSRHLIKCFTKNK